MILVALDPGPTMCGHARVRIEGTRATYVEGGLVNATLEGIEQLLRIADAVAVEVPRGYIFQPARGAQLLATAHIAGGICWMAQSRGLPLVEFTGQEWRRGLTGKGSRVSDHMVKDAVESAVIGVPSKTNVHVRDALGLAVVAAWRLHGVIGDRARA